MISEPPLWLSLYPPTHLVTTQLEKPTLDVYDLNQLR